jgi:hypothetical protein
MINLDYQNAQNVSDNIIATHIAIDEALLKLSDLTQSMVIACRDSAMPASQSQKALEAVNEGFTSLMASRRGFVSAHKHMIMVRGISTQKETDFGCLGGGPIAGNTPLRVVA